MTYFEVQYLSVRVN